MSAIDKTSASKSLNANMLWAVSTPSKRILVLDVLRGMAVFGILVRNIFVYAMPSNAFALPALWSSESVANVASWLTVEIFFDGSMRAIFSMLFGATALIILAECDSSTQGFHQVDRYYRRLLVLIGLGLIHAYLLLWPNDVLFFYGVFGFLLFPLRNLSAKYLLAAAGMMILLFAAVQIYNSLPEPETAQNEVQNSSNELSQFDEYLVTEIEREVDQRMQELLHKTWQEEVEVRQSGYAVNLREGFLFALERQTIELMTNHLIDICAMLFIGMALFKLGFLTGQKSSFIYCLVMVSGYGVGISLKVAPLYGWYQYLPEPYSQWDWGTINYDFARIAIALAHLSALILALRLRMFSRFANMLAASGRLSLTNYLSHTLVGAFVFYGLGLGLFGRFNHAQLLALAILFGVSQIVLSSIYLRHFRRGPFEHVLHTLVYTGTPRVN